MKVLVGMPCALGMVTSQACLSLLDTQASAANHKQEFYRQLMAQNPGLDQRNPEHVAALQKTMNQYTIDCAVYQMSGESLLTRARNHCAQVALVQGYDKLFFIDADMGWTWNDFREIALSPYPIIGGVAPLKTYPNRPNSFETPLNFLPFLEDEKYFDRSQRNLAGTIRMATGHNSPIVKVAFTGTAFLCIHRSVLLKLAETAPDYIYPDPATGQAQTHWSFFDGGPIDSVYYSEDWVFCDKARNAGFDINIHTGVRISHTGNHTFVAG
jgi:hypothetical protein